MLLLRLRILDTSGATRDRAARGRLRRDPGGIAAGPRAARRRPRIGRALVTVRRTRGRRRWRPSSRDDPSRRRWVHGVLPLAVLAAVAEEALFRRAAYGWLERYGPGGRGHRLGAAVRGRARAALRRRRVPGRPRGRTAALVAAMGVGHLDRPGGHARRGQRAGGGPAMRKARGRSRVCVALVGVACTRGDASERHQGRAPSTRSRARRGRAASTSTAASCWPPTWSNQDGGVDGRTIQIESVDTPGADAAAAAVDQLHDAGIDLVLGSYGSTISGPASAEAAANGMLFWETGAVGHAPAGLRPRRPDVPRSRRPARCWAGRRSRSSPIRWRPSDHRDPADAPVRGVVRRRRVRRSVAAGAEARTARPRAPRRRQLRLRLPHRRHGEARAADRRRQARRPVRLGVPRRRDRAAAPAGRPARAAAREHRHVVELLHAGVRRDAGQGRGRRLRVGQAVGVLDQPLRPSPATLARCCSARTTRTTRRGTRT